MTQQNHIKNIERTQEEIQQLGHEVISYLQRLCDDYDNGNTFAIVLVAVLLRTLLKTKGDTKSVLHQLVEYDVEYIQLLNKIFNN